MTEHWEQGDYLENEVDTKDVVDSDDLYEIARDDADIQKMEESDKLQKMLEESRKNCEICGQENEEEDLDLVEGRWICRECEREQEEVINK